MKGKKYYLVVAGLILIGIGSVLFYRQQQEARVLEFEGYEITAIEEQVNDLYNDEKTDLQKDTSEEAFRELDETFDGLMEQRYSGRNRQRIQQMYQDFLTAYEMFETEGEVDSLFEEEGVVIERASLAKVREVKEELESFGDKPVYYERNLRRLETAKEQVEMIEKVEALLNSFYDEEGHLLEEVTRAEEEEVLALISQIRNSTVQEKWHAEADKLAVALTEAEEALAQEEALEEQRLLEEQMALEEEQRLLEEAAAQEVIEEPLEEAPVNKWVPPVPNPTPPPAPAVPSTPATPTVPTTPDPRPTNPVTPPEDEKPGEEEDDGPEEEEEGKEEPVVEDDENPGEDQEPEE